MDTPCKKVEYLLHTLKAVIIKADLQYEENHLVIEKLGKKTQNLIIESISSDLALLNKKLTPLVAPLTDEESNRLHYIMIETGKTDLISLLAYRNSMLAWAEGRSVATDMKSGFFGSTPTHKNSLQYWVTRIHHEAQQEQRGQKRSRD